MTRVAKQQSQRVLERGPALAAILFFAAGLVWLGSSAHFHGDERYYTDAALRMLASGDPWTPQWADGTVRANKPLVTYWVLMASFGATGVSYFVARLPFLLAGAIVVWLAGRLTRTLFPQERAAPLLASLIVASDYGAVMLARRSTPDILLVLFTTISLCGLARIVVARDDSTSARATFWLGGALAIATKGGLGLFVLVFGTVILLVTRTGGSARKLFPIGICVASLAVACTGLLPSMLLEARPGSVTLIDDQVGARIAGSIGEVGRQLVHYAGSLMKHFLPWILFLAAGAIAAGAAFRERWRTHRTACLLAFGWTAALWILFSCSNTHRGRYLAPAHALFAAGIAPFLLDVARTQWGKRSVWAAAFIVVGVSTAFAVLAARIDLVTGLACLAPLAFFLLGVRFVRDEARGLCALALALLGVMTVGQEGVFALIAPSPLPLAVERVASLSPRPARVATLGFAESAAGQVRVFSGGRIDPVALRDKVSDDVLATFDVVIANETFFERLRANGFVVEALGRAPRNLDVHGARALFLAGEALDTTVFAGPLCGVALREGSDR